MGAIIIENAKNVTANYTIAAASFSQLAGSGDTTLKGDIAIDTTLKDASPTTDAAGVNINTNN
ncbi:MAG TPA: hypothetical protein DD000_05835, partial [Cyanobacteria bacterium UBA11166]|nr:hypothetical protein [Cyanobacteria bacterium UBA11166]